MSRRRQIHGFADRQDDTGLWMRTWREQIEGDAYTAHSRSYGLWGGIKTRCQEGGSFQRKEPTYIGCINGFSDFQEFAEWATAQHGYSEVDHQRMPFQIDKDILLPGNKIYGAETCCFVPRRINSMLTSSKALRGDLPVGVSFHKSRRKFSAYCNTGTRMKYLGLYLNPEDAHRAWQIEKSAVIKSATAEYEQGRGSNPGVVEALIRRANSILEDAENYRITVEV